LHALVCSAWWQKYLLGDACLWELRARVFAIDLASAITLLELALFSIIEDIMFEFMWHVRRHAMAS
jgi:hypothetical protein